MKREPLIDNAKFLLIYLVVFGHVIQPFNSDVYFNELIYYWIYLFHMPAFIFLSGFFAKGEFTKSYIANLSKKLLLPYIIFQFIYSIYFYILSDKDIEWPILEPHWSLWFLLSLFCWHLLLMIFKKIQPLISIGLALLIGIFIGYVDEIGHTLSLSRTFAFFPFFLFGYHYTKEHLLLLKKKGIKLIAFIFLLTVGVGLYFAPEFSTKWLLASSSYHTVGFPEIGGVIRLGLYVISILMTFSLLAWIPSKNYPFTKLGERTIYVYLLHGLFIHFFRKTEIFEVNHLLDMLVLSLISLLIVLLLSNKSTITYTQPIVEGKWTLIKERFLKSKSKIDDTN